MKFILTFPIIIFTYFNVLGQGNKDILRDSLESESIVVIDYHSSKSLFESYNAVTVISNPSGRQAQGIAELMLEAPGVFADGSLGEVYTRIFTRGVSASAQDDIGWYYQSLQEDGLPITAIQYNYFTPDLFQRTDLMTQKLEIIRGGKSGILFQNSPGGSVNFVSSNRAKKGGTLKSTFGLLGQSNVFSKTDFLYSIPFSDESLSLMMSGFYRYDQGHRNTDYAWSKGGQFRAKLQKTFGRGVFKLILKHLDDHVNRHTGMSAVNWSDPIAAFDQNFNYTALMLPNFESSIGGPEPYEYNSSDGIHVKELALQPELDLDYNGLRINIKGKLSRKRADWNTSFANQPLGLESFLPYFLSGGQFPFGKIEFNDVVSGETLAIVNNQGALNVFQGQPAEFEYLDGSLPHNALMGIAPWKKKDELDEYMLQFGISENIGLQELYFGGFYSYSALDYFTSASYAFATFEAEPRLLNANLLNTDGSVTQLSDDNGMSNYGGLFYENGAFDVNQFAVFVNDEIAITENLNVELGLRYESVSHSGELEVPGQIEMPGGLDGDILTDYDNSTMVSSGQQENIDFSYNYLSFSSAFSYVFSEQDRFFFRFSRSKKAPELNYYIQNFSGLPFETEGEVQQIEQYEIGYRMKRQKLDISFTAFLSEHDNIGLSDFVFDQQTNDIFYAPVQINSTMTSGVELQWNIDLIEKISLKGSQTIQSSEALDYTIYDSAGSSDTSDDKILDFSGKELAHTPGFMSKVSLVYDNKKLRSSLSWQYMSSRYGNIENSFELDAFSNYSFSMDYQLSSNIACGLHIKNMFNSKGLMNFFGPNEFGSSANQATASYIENNPEASFVVFPILPRAVYLSVSYIF